MAVLRGRRHRACPDGGATDPVAPRPGLSTEIGRSTRVKGRKRRQLARLRREHNRAQVRSKRERNQVYAFTEIRRIVGSLDLSDAIRDRACVLFESAQEADLLRGRSLEGFAAAGVYATCRTEGLARTVEELCAVARADESELRAAYDALNRELGLPTGPIDPREYVPRFATELELPTTVRKRAEELVDEARDRGLVAGRNPAGVAAACLYTAAGERDVDLTQAEAADVADVTPVTLRGPTPACRTERRPRATRRRRRQGNRAPSDGPADRPAGRSRRRRSRGR